MQVTQAMPVQVQVLGEVSPRMSQLAQAKVAAALRHVGEPVLFARVVLKESPDPAVSRPAMASVAVSVNGRVVRVRAVEQTMGAAVNRMAGRLRTRLSRAWLPRHVPHRPATNGDLRHRPAS